MCQGSDHCSVQTDQSIASAAGRAMTTFPSFSRLHDATCQTAGIDSLTNAKWALMLLPLEFFVLVLLY